MMCGVGGLTAKLGDLGATQKGLGSSFGTPIYRPPEGESEAHLGSYDMYALGVMLFTMYYTHSNNPAYALWDDLLVQNMDDSDGKVGRVRNYLTTTILPTVNSFDKKLIYAMLHPDPKMRLSAKTALAMVGANTYCDLAQLHYGAQARDVVVSKKYGIKFRDRAVHLTKDHMVVRKRDGSTACQDAVLKGTPVSDTAGCKTLGRSLQTMSHSYGVYGSKYNAGHFGLIPWTAGKLQTQGSAPYTACVEVDDKHSGSPVICTNADAARFTTEVKKWIECASYICNGW
jgi:serine/threonine protein kinase